MGTRWIVTPCLLVGLLLSSVGQGIAADGPWLDLTPAGNIPPPTRDMGLAYDSQRDRLVLTGSADSKTWIMDLTGTPSWSFLNATAAPGEDQRAVYDPVNDRVVIVTASSAVYSLDLNVPSAWVQIFPAGSAPPARSFFAVTRDASRNRLLLFGGGPYTGYFNDVWALSLSGELRWTQLSPTLGAAPPGRWGPSAVYDSYRDRLLVTAGSSDLNYSATSDVWALSLAGTPFWEQLIPSTPTPPTRLVTAAVYDPAMDRLLLFGGYSPPLGDLWEFSLATLAWNEIAPAGPRPAARFSHEAVYRSSPAAGTPQMIIGGGSGFNDTWALPFGALTGPPVVSAFRPLGGRIGDTVTVVGERLSNVSAVYFNGVGATISASSYGQMETTVPLGATTGPIRVVTPDGTSVSSLDFFVGEVPVISSAIPDSGIVGESVTILGRHFTGATGASFGGTGHAAFTVVQDSIMTLTVDSLATSGAIRVKTPAATGSSVFQFQVIPNDIRPRLLGVRDVPGDQGGRVMLTWRGSDYDQQPYRMITGYRVWRRAPATQATATRFAAGAQAIGEMATQVGIAQQVFWESIAELPAAYLRGYAYAAATLRDSLESGNPYTAFFVQALSTDPFAFQASSVDSGYSVDNLAPPMPMPFVAQYGAGQTVLHWVPSPVPDFREFRLYRGSSPAFVPGPAGLAFAGRDTGYVDHGVAGSYYKLAAVDLHGNVSRYALVSPTNPTAALATLVTAEWNGAAASLVWFVSESPGVHANVYRSEDGTSWILASVAAVDGDGYVRFTDPTVVAGHRYSYRLGVMDGDTEQLLAEGWIQIPAGRLAIRVVSSNPVRGNELNFLVELASSQPASVRVLDLAGRVLRAQPVRAASSNQQVLQLDNGTPLRPGVYLLELRQGGERRVSRFTYLR